jgi:LysW-gamma-L-lysine carboxypeptidase
MSGVDWNADPVALLERMVSIESVSGEEQQVGAFLADAMSDLGFDGHVDAAGNAVGVRSGPDEPGVEPRELVLLGHMDTVPGRIPVRIEDGKLHGRGSVDAKGPLATFIVAAARARLAPGVRLVVVGAVEEESSTSKGARFVAERPAPEACIIGEPSGVDAITLGYKGRLLIRYRATAPCGHGAGPLPAVGEAAAAFWLGVQEWCARESEGRERLFDQVLPTLRSFNTESDGLFESATVEVGLRLPEEFDRAAFEAHARELAGEAELETLGHEVAWRSQRTSTLARAFNKALRARGHRPRMLHKTGTADLNVLGPVWGCPILAYGPGDSLLDHTPTEHIVLEEYLEAIEVLGEALRAGGWAE